MYTKRDVHQDAVMSAISVKYGNGAAIADVVMPRIKVSKESDLYYIYTRNFRIPRAYRAVGSESNKIDWNVSTGNYFCEEYAYHDDVYDRDRKAADGPLDLDIDCVENLTEALITDREKRVADVIFSESIITNGIERTGTNQWNDYTNSDPLSDIQTGIYAVMEACGRKPNLVVLGSEVWRKLEQHPDLLDRIKYTQKSVMTSDLFGSLLSGTPKVVVGEMMYDDSQEGDPESLGYVWGKKCLIAYVEPSPGRKKVSLGYQLFHQDRMVDKWREPRLKGDRYEVTEVGDEKLVSGSCGYLIYGAVA